MQKKDIVISADIKLIIDELKAMLESFLKKNLKEVILFGSYSRGEQDKMSDIDILIILNKIDSFKELRNKYIPIISDLSLKYDILISIIPVRYNDYINKKIPLYMNIKKEGIKVWLTQMK